MDYIKARKKKKSSRLLTRRARAKRRKIKLKLFFKRSSIILFILGIISLIGFGFYFLANKVFSIKDITFEGNTIYTDGEVLDKSGLKIGNSMIFLDSAKVENDIYKSFGKIDDVKVNKIYPNSLKIDIKVAEPKMCVHRDDGFYIISEGNRVIEIVDEQPSEILNVAGIDLTADSSGRVTYKDEKAHDVLDKVIAGISKIGLSNVKSVDVSNPTNIKANYDNRIDIIFGSEEELDYKMVTLKEIINNKINLGEKGTLDLRDLSHENKSYFVPKT